MLADIGTVRYVSSRVCFPVSFNSAFAQRTPSPRQNRVVTSRYAGNAVMDVRQGFCGSERQI